MLEVLGAVAATSGIAATAAAQDDDDADDDGDGPDRLPIVLGGRVDYWLGVAPDAIEGEENPTLELEEGEEYELVWVNLDGVEHNAILEGEDGEELESSGDGETAGEAVSMTFEATAELSEYFCEYHPDSMRGSVELGDGFDLETGTDGDDTDGDGDDTDDGDGDGNDTTDDGNGDDTDDGDDDGNGDDTDGDGDGNGVGY